MSASREISSELEIKGTRPLPIGRQLLLAGKLSEQEVKATLTAQIQRRQPFGQIAVSLGFLSDADLQRALAVQYSYPYVIAEGSDIAETLVTAHRPFSAAAEAVRVLRSQLRLRWLNGERNVIVVTAPRRGQHASTVVANLGVAFAQSGERTLIIDADLRVPTQHRLFGLGPSAGLAGLLAGRISPNEAIQGIPSIPALSVLCAGLTPPNPQELLDGDRFAHLMQTAPASFDIVIVDTPPMLDCADAVLVSARVGGCVLVTRRHETRLDDVRLAKSTVDQSGAELIGAVICD